MFKDLLFEILFRKGVRSYFAQSLFMPSRFMRLGVTSFEMLFAQVFVCFPRKVFFRECFLSLFGTSSVRNGLALVQVYLSSWDQTLPGWDGFCMTLESRLPAAT